MAEHNKYNNSKIYKLVSASSDKIYVGSTTQLLCKRLQQHLSNYKQYIIDNAKQYVSSFTILALSDYSIQLIQECNYSNKQQLHEREGYYIKLHRDICVNNRMAGRTDSEYRNDNKDSIAEKKKQYNIDNKEKNKQYYTDNKQVLAEQKKQVYTDNKEIILEQQKQYRVNNKQVLAEKHKQYYTDNKDSIAEKKKQTIQCECGITSTKSNLSRHQQSKLHNTTIQNTNINMIYLNELTTL